VAGIFALALIVVVWRRWFSALVSAWREARHRAYLASPDYAFSQLRHAWKARDLDSVRTAFDLWTSRLDTVPQDDLTAVRNTFLSIGRSRFSSTPRRDNSQDWSQLWTLFQRMRKTQKNRHTAPPSLLPLNPAN
jgi:hypothetical protein